MQKIIGSVERPKLALPTFTGSSRKEYGLLTRRFQLYLRARSRCGALIQVEYAHRCMYWSTEESADALRTLGPVEGYKEALRMLEMRSGDTREHI